MSQTTAANLLCIQHRHHTNHGPDKENDWNRLHGIIYAKHSVLRGNFLFFIKCLKTHKLHTANLDNWSQICEGTIQTGLDEAASEIVNSHRLHFLCVEFFKVVSLVTVEESEISIMRIAHNIRQYGGAKDWRFGD